MKTRFRTQKLHSSAAKVDRENRRITGVSAIQTGEALGHRLLIDDTMLSQVAALGNKAPAIKSRFTHPGLSSDGMGKMLGKMSNFSVQGDKVVGDLQFADHASKSPDGDLADYVMSMAEESPNDFGMSIVFSGMPVWKTTEGKEIKVNDPALCVEGPMGKSFRRPHNATTEHPFARADKLYAVDAVDEPAANRDGLFSAAFAGTTNLESEEVYEALDELRDRVGLTEEKAHSFVSRYFAARGVTDQPTGSPVNTQETSMEKEQFKKLLQENPEHAVLLSTMFADQTSAAVILEKLAEAKGNALAQKFAEAQEQIKKLQADAIEADKAHKAEIGKLSSELGKLKDAHDKLSKLGAAPETVGGDAQVVGTMTADEKLEQQWAALSTDEKLHFLNDKDAFKHWKLNEKNDRSRAKARKEA